MGAPNDRGDRAAFENRVRDLERRLRSTRRWLAILTLAAVVLVVGAWVQEAQEVRTQRIVIVDPDVGTEGSIRVEGGDLVLQNPNGSRTRITGEGALILGAGRPDPIRIGGSPARPLH